MFPLQPSTVREHLIHILADHPGSSSAHILIQLKRRYGSVTKQAMHKELRSLILAQAVTKAKRTYALGLPWIWACQNALEKVESKQVSPQSLKELLPDRDQKIAWHFTSLLRLKVFWSHLVLASMAQAKTKKLYSWNPHTWFYLLLGTHEDQVLDGLQRKGAILLKIIGSGSALDRSTASFWKHRTVKYSFAQSPFKSEMNLYFSVVDDWILSFAVSPETKRELESFYRSNTQFNQDTCAALLEILRKKRRVRFEIRNAPQQARRIRKKFDEFFGI